MAVRGCGIPPKPKAGLASRPSTSRDPVETALLRAAPLGIVSAGRPGPLALRLWRHLGPRSMDGEIRGALLCALIMAEKTRSRGWVDTVRSALDPGGPIHPSINFLHCGNVDSPLGDEMMSALALRGLGGDCAASTVLANGLAILAHGHRASARLMGISDEWSSLASLQRTAVSGERR